MKKQKPEARRKRTKKAVNRLVKAVRPKTSVTRASDAFPVIAMAASVGGLEALSVILRNLPADFPAAIAIVMHLSPNHKSILAEILARRTHLMVKEAHTGDVLCRSCVFVAPPNHHLFVASGGRLRLSSPEAKKINFARPSAEPLFVSVAKIYRQDAVAVVLTGGDGDGSFGVQIIKDHGGKVIAQDRPTSQNFSMPRTAIETGDVDFILPLDKIAAKLTELAGAGKGAADSQHSLAAVYLSSVALAKDDDRREHAATLDGGHRPPRQVRKIGIRPLQRLKPILDRSKRQKTPALANVAGRAKPQGRKLP